jgi:hypothetical protein
MRSEMTDPSSGGAAFLAAKAIGGKALMGMLGAALLYAVMPPVNKDGTFNRAEFVIRLACAGTFSIVFGDWAVTMLMEFLPRLHADKHVGAVWLLAGAPGWWFSRAAALAMYRHRDKDLLQVWNKFKGKDQ